MLEPPATYAIVGATGAVGLEALAILEQRRVALRDIRVFASPASSGRRIPYRSGFLTVEAFDVGKAAECDFTLLCASSSFARANVADLLDADATVIDNSSAFRMTPGVPLIIPEVNGRALDGSERLVANPNCSTIMLLTALDPIRRTLGVRDIVVSTYQAVSGAGARAIDELRVQTVAALAHRAPPPRVFPQTCAFNVFPHESPVDPETGLNVEEQKIIDETRRIWDAPELPIAPTCVRVPVVRAHSQSVTVTLAVVSEDLVARACLRGAPGVRLIEHDAHHSITPRRVAGTDEVYVGRIRFDRASGNRRLSLWLCADQLRKGAALNAIQIADRLHALRRDASRSLL